MEASNQVHDLAALSPEKRNWHTLDRGWDWTPDAISTLWRTQKSNS